MSTGSVKVSRHAGNGVTGDVEALELACDEMHDGRVGGQVGHVAFDFTMREQDARVTRGLVKLLVHVPVQDQITKAELVLERDEYDAARSARLLLSMAATPCISAS